MRPVFYCAREWLILFSPLMGTLAQTETFRKPSKYARFIANADFVSALVVAAGFLLRLRIASRTFLNADEALHFMAANQPSWKLTYHASLTISHPPLLIFVLHVWRALGTSELILRLPCVLAGTAFCWIFYNWVSVLFGPATGLLATIFTAFAPPMISLSAEVRQYAFLLFFVVSTLYLLERALAENSPLEMFAASLCLSLAILSHYSAVLLAPALAVYIILRMVARPPSRTVIAIWITGQLLAVGVCLLLYFTYLAAFGGRITHNWMEIYLPNSYFDPAKHNALAFILERTISIFQFSLGQPALGDLMFLILLVAIVATFRKRGQTRQISSLQLTALFLLPFVITCAAALFGRYPYGGTRHCVFLTIFVFAALAAALWRLTQGSPWVGAGIAVAVVIAANVFAAHRFPYIAPEDQSRAHMREAIAFIQQQVPTTDVLFTDSQSSLLLGHYLCEQQPFFIDVWTTGLKNLYCGGHHIVATDGRVFVFDANNFPAAWNDMTRESGLKRGDSVWVVEAGWVWQKPLVTQLQQRNPSPRELNVHSFGHNITMFQLRLGELQSTQ